MVLGNRKQFNKVMLAERFGIKKLRSEAFRLTTQTLRLTDIDVYYLRPLREKI